MVYDRRRSLLAGDTTLGIEEPAAAKLFIMLLWNHRRVPFCDIVMALCALLFVSFAILHHYFLHIKCFTTLFFSDHTNYIKEKREDALYALVRCPNKSSFFIIES